MLTNTYDNWLSTSREKMGLGKIGFRYTPRRARVDGKNQEMDTKDVITRITHLLKVHRYT